MAFRIVVSRVTLVSFDIDGTLEVGEPPGIVPIALVREAKRLGYLIGSCSDRPISFQRDLWERLRIAVDFTVLKHHLARRQGTVRGDGVLPHRRHRHRRPTTRPRAGFKFLRADARDTAALAVGALRRARRPALRA